VSPAKTAEPIDMWTRVGPRNVVLDGVQISMRKDNFEGEGSAPCKVWGPSAVSCAKTAEPIEMPFGVWTRVGRRKHVLDGDAHWHHQSNAIEQSMCGGDAAFCQITLTTCY